MRCRLVVRNAGHAVIQERIVREVFCRRILRGGESIEFVRGGETCGAIRRRLRRGRNSSRLARRDEFVEPSEGIRDPLDSLKDARPIVGRDMPARGCLSGQTGDRGFGVVLAITLFGILRYPVPDERRTVRAKEPGQENDGKCRFNRRHTRYSHTGQEEEQAYGPEDRTEQST